jgi:hypothetical protein
MFLSGSARAQRALDATRSPASSENPSSLVDPHPSPARTAGEQHRSAPAQQFVCNAGFTVEQCNQEMLILRKALANYRASELGEWTWVLVGSEDWRFISLARGLDPGVPALTALDARTTFFEEALVGGQSWRAFDLMNIWHRGRESLLISRSATNWAMRSATT